MALIILEQQPKNVYSCVTELFRLCEDIHTLRLTSELVDLRAGYAKWIQ